MPSCSRILSTRGSKYAVPRAYFAGSLAVCGKINHKARDISENMSGQHQQLHEKVCFKCFEVLTNIHPQGGDYQLVNAKVSFSRQIRTDHAQRFCDQPQKKHRLFSCILSNRKQLISRFGKRYSAESPAMCGKTNHRIMRPKLLARSRTPAPEVTRKKFISTAA